MEYARINYISPNERKERSQIVKSTSTSAINVNQLFQQAHNEGTLSAQSLQTLEQIDIGVQIQAGLGVSVENVHASEVILVTMMVDDSGSIRFSGNAQTVREGHNTVLDALAASKQSGGILSHTCYLNGTILFPYLPMSILDDLMKKRTGVVRYVPNPLVVRMDTKNYDPNEGTPLYDQTVVLLGRVLPKYQEFAEAGVMARTITLIITDGADEHSTTASAASVKSLVQDLIGENHIVAGMGIAGGGQEPFRNIFRQMGIPDQWILTPGSNSSEIRKTFQVFSQYAVRASQGAAQFNQTGAGGFLTA